MFKTVLSEAPLQYDWLQKSRYSKHHLVCIWQTQIKQDIKKVLKCFLGKNWNWFTHATQTVLFWNPVLFQIWILTFINWRQKYEATVVLKNEITQSTILYLKYLTLRIYVLSCFWPKFKFESAAGLKNGLFSSSV